MTTTIQNLDDLQDRRIMMDRDVPPYGYAFVILVGLFMIFLLVGMTNILDVAVIGNGSVLRTAVIFFYISNEGVSLLENAGHLGLPIPQKVKEVLEQLHDRSEKRR